MSEEEKKMFLLKQADMYLSGMSYRQIAKVVGQSYVTVRDNLTVKIRYIAPNKYMEVMEKIEENKEKSIEDASVRERVLEAYRLLTTENKTVIVISHRLANVTDAKNIYVMNKGKLVENGTHEELMKNESCYYNMVNKQNELEMIREVC